MINFNKVLNFPCMVDFRVIVSNQPENEELVIKFFDEHFKLKVKTPIEKKASKKGNYVSLIIKVMVKSEEQMNEIYDLLAKEKYVKYVL